MIDPKELRIGNWVNAYHGDVQVVQIGKEIITTPNLIGATHGAILSPIPLTSEILEKCGFEYDLHTHSIDNFWLAVNSKGEWNVWLHGLSSGIKTRGGIRMS